MSLRHLAEAYFREIGPGLFALSPSEIDWYVANWEKGGFEKLLWANLKRFNKPINYYDNPVYVEQSPFDPNDKVVFERKQYGKSVVIEANGMIVDVLCQ